MAHQEYERVTTVSPSLTEAQRALICNKIKEIEEERRAEHKKEMRGYAILFLKLFATIVVALVIWSSC